MINASRVNPFKMHHFGNPTYEAVSRRILPRMFNIYDVLLSARKRVEAKVFRASVPVSSGGVLSVCTDHATGAVFCGGGNGVLRKVFLRQSACARYG